MRKVNELADLCKIHPFRKYGVMDKQWILVVLKLTITLLYSANLSYGQQVNHISIKDTLFESPQLINILSLQKKDLPGLELSIALADSLELTSQLGKKHRAIAAINGGFFDTKQGNSVSYIELDDQIKQVTVSTSDMLNASLIIEKHGDIIIQYELPDSSYLKSQKEKAVLGAGPVLLLNAYKVPIDEKSFSLRRHPRTCVCERDEDLLFITIDGRRPNAYGMSLFELQEYLLSLDCIDAINLDGGGSTSMWIENKGIVNQPSDFSGERKVSNAILIKYR